MKTLDLVREHLTCALAAADLACEMDEPVSIAEAMAQAGFSLQQAVILMDAEFKAFGPALEGRARELAARG